MAVELGVGYVSVLPSTRGFGRALSKDIGGAASSAGQDAGKRFKGSFSSGLKGLASLAGGAVAAVGAVKLVGDTIAAARESAKVQAQTVQVIKTTGGAAKVSAKQVSNYATRLSNLTGVDDEVIQSGENLLLTFTNVQNRVGKGNDIFNQATAVANDMSVALGQDMKSSSIQLGKALNDPVKGITALSRVGVSFTAQQKKQIKGLVEHGKTLEAQKVILAELGKEFGGSAAAVATPMQKLKVTLGNLQEDIGARFLPVIDKAASFLAKNLPGALDAAGKAFGKVQKFAAPFIDLVSDIFRTLTQGRGDIGKGLVIDVAGMFGIAEDDPRLTKFFDIIEKIEDVIGSVVRFVKSNLKPVLIGLGAVFLALVSPIALAIAAIAAIGAGLVLAYQRSETFRNVVDGVVQFVKTNIVPVFTSAFGAVQAIVATVVKVVSDLWARFGDQLIGHIVIALRNVQQILQGAFAIITGIFQLITSILTGKWGKAWEAIKKIFGGAWDVIVGLLKTVLNNVSTIIGAAMAGISALWGLAWDAIVTLVKAAFGKVIDFIGGVPKKLASAGKGMFDFLKEAFKGAINFIIRGWNSLKFKIPGFHKKILGKNFGFDGFTLGVPTIHELASGGLASSPIFAAAEAGREAILPLDNAAAIRPIVEALGAGGRGQIFGDIVLHQNDPDPQHIMEAAWFRFKEFEAVGN